MQLGEGEKVRRELAERLSSTDLKLRQKEVEMERTRTSCVELQTQVTLLSADVEKFKVTKL